MILIKNGTVVNSDSIEKLDVLCSKSKIIKVGSDLDCDNPNCTVIDAKGCYVLPGGIDPHVHMYLPSTAGFSSDDFESGSKAALHGGTTTILDFVTPKNGETLDNAITKRIAEAAKCVTDYSFHISPIEWQSNLDKQIKRIVNKGFTSFKVYMAYKETIGLNDDALRKVMNIVGNAGGILLIHCEMGDEIEQKRNELVSEGKTEPKYHPASRPPLSESEAVKKAIDISYHEKCPIYIVHVSTKESLEHIRAAQTKGQIVFAETCPQYLMFDDSLYVGEFKETSKYVMSPPLRKQSDCDALWEAVADGTIATIGTDHCPFNSSQKEFGRNDFRMIPNGVGGVEYRMQILYTYGVVTGRISMNKFVQLTSSNAAEIFGLYPEKGIIKNGSDADITIWNPDSDFVISKSDGHQNCDINIYEGMKITGSPKLVINWGKIVVNT